MKRSDEIRILRELCSSRRRRHRRVEKDLIDVEGQILVSLNSPLNAYEENKRVRRQAQLGNLRVKQTEMVGVAKRCLI